MTGFTRILAATLAVSGVAHAHRHHPEPDPEVVLPLQAAAFETPESIQFDRHGDMLLSLALTGEIRRVAPDGTQRTVGWLPIEAAHQPCENAFGVGIMGALTLGPADEIYVSVNSCDATKIGIYQLSDGEAPRRVAALDATTVPNGLAWHAGRLYLADTNGGRVLRIDPRDGTVEVWSADPLLTPLPDFFPGPNGLQIFRNEVYVSVSDRYHVVAIPIRGNGRAGTPRVHATGVGLDDFAFDVQGNLYGTTDPFNTLVKIAPDGTVSVLADASDGLDGPTSAAFGVHGHDRETLYFCNAAFPFFSTTHTPSIMRLHVGIPGAAR